MRGDNTAIQVRAKQRLAERRQCPKCGRKGALKVGETEEVVSYCRWILENKCDYVNLIRN